VKEAAAALEGLEADTVSEATLARPRRSEGKAVARAFDHLASLQREVWEFVDEVVEKR